MTSYTYATLKQTTIRWLQDLGSDFATSFDEGLALAEDDIAKDLNCDQMQFRSAINFVAGTYLYTRPAGADAIRVITYVNGTDTVQMEMRRHEWLMDYNKAPGVLANRAPPKYWAPYETLNTATMAVTSQIMVAMTPGAGYVASAECEGRIAGLSATLTTTWLSTTQGDLLFAACQKRMGRFDQESEFFQDLDNAYKAQLTRTQELVARARSDATSVMRVA